MSSYSPKTDGLHLNSIREIFSLTTTPLKPSRKKENKGDFFLDHTKLPSYRTPNANFGSGSKSCNKVLNLQGMFMSPNTNYLGASPASWQKIIECHEIERINVQEVKKLFDSKAEPKKGNKENSRNNSAKKSLFNCDLALTCDVKEKSAGKLPTKKFTEDLFAKKNLMILFDINNKSNSSNENNEILNNFTMLSRKNEREEVSSEEDFLRRKDSIRDIILNSPKRKESLNTDACETNDWRNSTAKKMIFSCSAQKSVSILDSQVKSSRANTLNSSEKKDRRRMRKTNFQLNVLKSTYYENTNRDWTKEMIAEIANKIGLDETKVYKWFWDKKNKDCNDRRVFVVSASKREEK